MKKFFSYIVLNFVAITILFSQAKITTPPMGWNSYDSYGVYLHHDAAIKNIDELARKYKEFGYNYFVIDAGWFGEFKLRPGTKYAAEKHALDLNINEYGLLQPSKTYFPHGIKVLVDRAHSKGLKFGIHIMRGISRKAVRMNTKVQGTNYRAQDIADTTSICKWNPQNVGVDMTKPGSQEFYNSYINQLASWGVDFIKADDIIPFPTEVEALAKAIAQCGRPIVLSLSPGGNTDPKAMKIFKMGNMLRVTHDIWDDQYGIDQGFAEWRKWVGSETPSFYPDLDMIPFGELVIMNPKPDWMTGKESSQEIEKFKSNGKLTNAELLAGKGWHRQSEFTKEQQLTFITMRALAASPLMIGGDLVSYEKDKVETWITAKKNTKNSGWIGIFNRNLDKSITVNLTEELVGLTKIKSLKFFNVWENMNCKYNQKLKISANSVIFLKYSN